ncbi:MAG: hypothetical protein HY744_31375 [Deltaproteobacteria bacterium]|nr:hypothetical protein [Deltaproteobacteria bacterium]
MRMRRVSPLCAGSAAARWAAAAALALLALLPGSLRAEVRKDRPPQLPPAPARLWVVAPWAQGPWLVRIDNEGTEAVRIPADVRLLRIEIYPSQRRGWARRPLVCDGPAAFGLSDGGSGFREMLLGPGQSYVELFDPRLICFGRLADALVPGVRIDASLGWPERLRWARGPERPPFAADGTRWPRDLAPRRRLRAPTMLLSHAVSPWSAPWPGEPLSDAGGAGPPPPEAGAAPAVPAARDDLAGRLGLTASRYADASNAGDIAVSVEAHNIGERPIVVALRARQLSFLVDGPDGLRRCPQPSAEHAVPRDLFATLGAGEHTHLQVLLGELCPDGAFPRAGLHRARPTLHADETGREHGLEAAIGVVTTVPGNPLVKGEHARSSPATLVRLRHARLPFYAAPAAPVPTDSIGASSELVESRLSARGGLLPGGHEPSGPPPPPAADEPGVAAAEPQPAR